MRRGLRSEAVEGTGMETIKRPKGRPEKKAELGKVKGSRVDTEGRGGG